MLSGGFKLGGFGARKVRRVLSTLKASACVVNTTVREVEGQTFKSSSFIDSNRTSLDMRPSIIDSRTPSSSRPPRPPGPPAPEASPSEARSAARGSSAEEASFWKGRDAGMKGWKDEFNASLERLARVPLSWPVDRLP